MSTVISKSEMLEIQLRKWIRREHTYNVVLHPASSHPAIAANECIIAEITNRRSEPLYFTKTAFTAPGRGLIHYDDIVMAAWISTQPNKSSRKETDHDHIELMLRDGTPITLEDLSQAVFPLLKFFEWACSSPRKKPPLRLN
ncbi:MAG: hypothetical protein QM796_05500 [Chthoniobacteraceae bacterium]